MPKLLHLSLSIALAGSLCAASAQAQRGMRAGGSRVSAPIAVRSAPAQTVRLSGRNGVVTLSPFFSPGFPVSPFTFSTFGVPGFGFDYVHLAAITRGLTPSNFRAFFPRRHVRGSTPFFPILFPLDPVMSPIVLVQQPPLEVGPPEVDEEDVAPPPPPRTRYREAPPVPQEEAAPLPPPAPNQDTGEYVLVKRDGSLLFAVAFSARGDQLVYVTREGLRKSFPVAQLDPGATRQMNEQRGTSIQLPQ